VNESLETLSGEGPADVRELTLALGAELLVTVGVEPTREAARTRLAARLDEGAAMEKFREMVAAQGGDFDAPRPVAPASEVVAPRDGFVCGINTEKLGMAIVELGGGRKKQGDAIDHSVGLEMLVRQGELVEERQPLVRIFARAADANRVRSLVAGAFSFGESPPPQLPLIVGRPEWDEADPANERGLSVSPPHGGVPQTEALE
jgi:thymidine phosphorylase